MTYWRTLLGTHHVEEQVARFGPAVHHVRPAEQYVRDVLGAEEGGDQHPRDRLRRQPVPRFTGLGGGQQGFEEFRPVDVRRRQLGIDLRAFDQSRPGN